MNKGKTVLLVISALVCVSLGFVVGQVVQATGNQPGSKSDPLVTRSYVEESVGAKLSVLQTQLDELQAEVSQLKGDSAILPTPNGTADGKTPADANKPAQSKKQVRITAETVNVRQEASTDASVIDSVNQDDVLTYLDSKDGWYKIQTSDGTTGYVADYLAEMVE